MSHPAAKPRVVTVGRDDAPPLDARPARPRRPPRRPRRRLRVERRGGARSARVERVLVQRVPGHAARTARCERAARVAASTSRHVRWVESARVGLFFLEFGGPPRNTTVWYDRAGSAAAALEARSSTRPCSTAPTTPSCQRDHRGDRAESRGSSRKASRRGADAAGRRSASMSTSGRDCGARRGRTRAGGACRRGRHRRLQRARCRAALVGRLSSSRGGVRFARPLCAQLRAGRADDRRGRRRRARLPTATSSSSTHTRRRWSTGSVQATPSLPASCGGSRPGISPRRCAPALSLPPSSARCAATTCSPRPPSSSSSSTTAVRRSSFGDVVGASLRGDRRSAGAGDCPPRQPHGRGRCLPDPRKRGAACRRDQPRTARCGGGHRRSRGRTRGRSPRRRRHGADRRACRCRPRGRRPVSSSARASTSRLPPGRTSATSCMSPVR